MKQKGTCFREVGLKLFENGYPVLPLNGKAPMISNWAQIDIDLDRVRRWHSQFGGSNVGVRCDFLAALDLDVPDPQEAARLREQIFARFPGGLIRARGEGGKHAIFYRKSHPKAEYRLVGGKKYAHLENGTVELFDHAGLQIGAFSENLVGGDYRWKGPSLADVPISQLNAMTPADWGEIRLLLEDMGYHSSRMVAPQCLNFSPKKFEDFNAHGLFSVESQIDHIRALQAHQTGWDNAVTALAGALARDRHIDKLRLMQIAELITWPGYHVQETYADLLSKIIRFMVKDAMKSCGSADGFYHDID